MFKILTVIAILAVIAIGIYFYLKLSSNPQTKDKPIPDTKIDVLGSTSNDPINLIVDQAKETIEETSQNIITVVKEETYDKTKSAVDTIFNQTPSNSKPSVSVEMTNSYPLDTNLFTIDFNKDTNLKLGLTKGIKYSLAFKNVPKNYCLYIAENKYVLSEDNYIQIQFNFAGSFPIKLNLCDEKTLGNLVVQ